MLLEGEQETKMGDGRGRELALAMGFDPDNPGELTDMFAANGDLIIRK